MPFPLNNISGINNHDISSEIDNYSYLINKNFNFKNKEEEEDNKVILKSIKEESEENKIKERKTNINIIKKKNIKIENEKLDEDSKIFNIINNRSNNKSNESFKNEKDDNAFFSKSNESDEDNPEKDKLEIEKKKKNLLINLNNINLNKNENYIMSSSSSSKSISKLKHEKNFNINIEDLNILKQTNTKAKILYFENNIFQSINITHITNMLNNDNNINKIYNKNDSIDDEIINGNYKFSFAIIPKSQIKKKIKIEVGFEVNFIDENDIDIINEEENTESDDSNEIPLHSLIQKFCILRQFQIYKKTNQIYVLINIEKGKFFVVGEKELNIKNNKDNLLSNSFNILYICNFQMILLERIKEVKPIFKYDKKALNVVEISINGRKTIE